MRQNITQICERIEHAAILRFALSHSVLWYARKKGASLVLPYNQVGKESARKRQRERGSVIEWIISLDRRLLLEGRKREGIRTPIWGTKSLVLRKYALLSWLGFKEDTKIKLKNNRKYKKAEQLVLASF